MTRFYSLDSLRQELARYEQRYGILSEVFFGAHLDGRVDEAIDPFDAVVWADTCREAARLAARPTPPRPSRPARGSETPQPAR